MNSKKQLSYNSETNVDATSDKGKENESNEDQPSNNNSNNNKNTSIENNGIAKMQHRDDLVIPAKQSLKLVSGGIHIMLMGLKDIPSNNQFQLTLGNAERKYQVTVNIVER